VLARLGRADADLGVLAARHAHAHDVDVPAGEQVIEGGFRRAAALGGERLGSACGHVGDRDQPSVRQQVDCVSVDGRDDAGTDNPEATDHGTDATPAALAGSRAA
jgi:hypothetical protein